MSIRPVLFNYVSEVQIAIDIKITSYKQYGKYNAIILSSCLSTSYTIFTKTMVLL